MNYDDIIVIDCSFDRDGIRMRQVVNVEDLHMASVCRWKHVLSSETFDIDTWQNSLQHSQALCVDCCCVSGAQNQCDKGLRLNG